MQKSIIAKLGDELSAFALTVGIILLMMTVVGCSKTPSASVTKDTLEIRNTSARITEFREQRTQESMNAVERSFIDLDKEIAELEVYIKEHEGMKKQEAESKLSFMKNARSDLMAEFNKAKINNTADKVANNIENTVNGDDHK